MGDIVLGIDIGGSGIKGAPVDLATGELTQPRHRIPTPRPATPTAVAETVGALVRHFEWTGPVGCGYPAVVRNGVVETASNMDPSWVGTDAADLFARTSGLPFHVLNDADAAGMAEMRFGAGRENRGLMLLVTVGTGIGTAVWADGKLFPNTEFGQLPLHGGIAEHYAAAPVRKAEGLSWKQWGERLEEFLQLTETLIWPERIIIGGGVSKKHEKFLPDLKTRASLVPAHLKNAAGIVGAALAVP